MDPCHAQRRLNDGADAEIASQPVVKEPVETPARLCHARIIATGQPVLLTSSYRTAKLAAHPRASCPTGTVASQAAPTSPFS